MDARDFAAKGCKRLLLRQPAWNSEADFASLQLITVEMAEKCATLRTCTDDTVEERSSRRLYPQYFRPLALPPASPNWTWPDDATVAEVATAQAAADFVPAFATLPVPAFPEDQSENRGHPNQQDAGQHRNCHQYCHPGGSCELGSGVQMGYRTARRYGVDRHEWTERARHRWGLM